MFRRDVVLALGSVALYFGSALLCFRWCFADAKRSTSTRLKTLFGLATISCALTWFFIAQWLREDSRKYPDTLTWLVDSDWMVQAYRDVSATPQQWFFSSQILHFAATFVAFLWVEGKRSDYSIRTVEAGWLGCAVAVSTAFPLFVAATHNNQRQASRPLRKDCILIVSLCILTVGTFVLPIVSNDQFSIVLGAMHLCVLLPLVDSIVNRFCGPEAPCTDVAEPEQNDWVVAIYGSLAGAAFISQLFNLQRFGPITPDRLWAAATKSHCQSSISADVLMVTLATMYLVFTSPRLPKLLRCLLFVLAPAVGVATVAPLLLAAMEVVGHDEDAEEAVDKSE